MEEETTMDIDERQNEPGVGRPESQFDERTDRGPAVGDRPADYQSYDDRSYDNREETAARQRAPISAGTMQTARARQRDEFGGFNLGAAFFGWLVAVGMGVLLTAIASAAGAALGLADTANDPTITNAETIGTVGAIVITVIGFVAYYCGGYVAGRMSRFDGARQGLGVWILGLLMTVILAAAGAIFGSEYNVLEQLNLPRIPVDEGTLATGGIITLIAVAIVTLVGSLLGGKIGEAYHRRVDRSVVDDDVGRADYAAR